MFRDLINSIGNFAVYFSTRMKKSIFLILLGLLCALSVSAQNKTDNQAANVPTVNYCELRKNPELYNNKIIRVHGIYESGFEVSIFYDEACSKDFLARAETWIWVLSRNGNCSDQKTRETIETFYSGKADSKLEVTFIGLFNKAKEDGGFGHLGGYKFQIKVSCIEEAKLLPSEKYGCKRIDDTKPFHYLAYAKTEIGEMPDYGNSSKKQNKEELVLLSLINNSNCSVTVPTTLNDSENRELEDQSRIPVVYELSSPCVSKKSRLITDRKQTLSVLSPGNSIYFAVPLRFLTKKPFEVRVPFNFSTQKADFYYQPFYFSRHELPENLRKDLDCNIF
jgi:hypothetical protein